MASIALTELTVPALEALEREQLATATAAFRAVTADGREATPAERRRVDRLRRTWERTLGEFERRGLMIRVA